MKQNEVSLGRFLRIVLLLLAVAVSYFVLDSLSSVLLPFAVAWLLAYLIHPLVCFVQYRLRVKYRLPSVLLSMLLIFSVIYAVAMSVVPAVHDELKVMKGVTLNFLSENIRNSSIPESVVQFFRTVSDEQGFTAMLNSAGESDVLSMAMERLQVLVLGTLNVVKQVFTSFIILLYTFFILIDFERVSKGWKPYVPKKWRKVVSKIWTDLVNGMNQYFRGQALVALSVGTLYAIGFYIIDFPMAIGFGLFIGCLNLVPYLQIVSIAPMVLLAMLKAAGTGADFWVVLLSAVIVLVVVQLVQDLVLVPKIMGKRMNLHPAVILLSLSIWGQLLGVLGMIVALPLTTLLLAYLKRYHEIAETSSGAQENILKEAIDSADIQSRNAMEKE